MHLKSKRLFILVNLLLLGASAIQSAPPKFFMVCGDSKILLVDYIDTYRTKLFDTVDDCKSTENGQQILVSSSSGAVAIIDTESIRAKFYAEVPNGHSVELLAGGRLIAASSISDEGNKLMLFDISKPDCKPLFTVALESAHGVVWDLKRSSLYALGYNVTREYKMVSTDVIRLNQQWTIKGIDGHDLQMVPGGDALFVTEESGAWKFNLTNYTFAKIAGFPDAANIKSLGQDNSFQYIYTIEEESYWTYHVRFFNPTRLIAFPDMHVYKARWFNVTLSFCSFCNGRFTFSKENLS